LATRAPPQQLRAAGVHGQHARATTGGVAATNGCARPPCAPHHSIDADVTFSG
jgi:hypothetical protein